MAQSIVSICNRALGKLGQDVTITSLSEASKHARAFARTWEPVRDYVLSAAVWPFATKVAALAVSTDPAVPGWRFVYDYPDDAVDALAVVPQSGVRAVLDGIGQGLPVAERDFQKVHGVSGTRIVSDLESAYLVYVAVIEDISRFPPQFVEALAVRLAWENAAVIAGEVGLRMRPSLMQEFEIIRNQAAVHELNESAEAPLMYVTPSLAARD